MTRQVQWGWLWAVLLLAACSESDLRIAEPVVYTLDEGELRGARLEVPEGAYAGTAALTMSAGEDIALDDVAEAGQAMAAAGPAVAFGPDGTQFSEPVTIALPFSTQAYNSVSSGKSAIAIVGRHLDGSEIKIDVGPVFMESVVSPNEPILIDVGPVFLVANEGNEENDVLLVFNVSSFSSYQVVRVDSCECENDGAACDAALDCVDCARWTKVSAGLGHTCGLFHQGGKSRMICWGDNGANQLGHDGAPGTMNYTAVDQELDQEWSAVASGDVHTCAINQQGKLYCWGAGGFGKLGLGSLADQATPTAAGDTDKRWTSVTVGSTHTCALDQFEKLWCWGGNGSGQLGIGNVGGHQTKPTPVSTEQTWTQVEAGVNHTCGIRSDGTLWCWGANDSSQLGVALEASKTGTPQQVRTAADDEWKTLAVGSTHACAITNGLCGDAEGTCSPEGTLFCWGSNGAGQLGHGSSSAGETLGSVQTANVWRQLVAGSSHTCALGDGPDGKGLFCWGGNASGQLMVSPSEVPSRDTPLLVDTVHNWARLSAGSVHNCGVVADGAASTLWCWGDNTQNKLGSSGLTDGTSTVPVPVTCPEDSELTQPCTPQCAPYTCGPDGCDGLCQCAAGFECTLEEVCQPGSGPIGMSVCTLGNDSVSLESGPFLKFVDDCMIACPFLAGAPDLDCLEICFAKDPNNLSGDCGGCFEKVVECAAAKCVDSCDYTTPEQSGWACNKACVNNSQCLQDLNACTGLCGDSENICHEAVETTASCPSDCPCQSNACETQECGTDECGDSCGTCEAGQICNSQGQCEDDGSCAPNCKNEDGTPKECGEDGCGGSCGDCVDSSICILGQCEDVCVPACAGKECGGDDCGGSCGECPNGESCEADLCEPEACIPDCSGGKVCGDDGCGGLCGICDPNFSCADNPAQGCLPDTCGAVGVLYGDEQTCVGETLIDCKKKGDDLLLTAIYCPADGTTCNQIADLSPQKAECLCSTESCDDGDVCTHDFCKGNECKNTELDGCELVSTGGFYLVDAVGTYVDNKNPPTVDVEPAMDFSSVKVVNDLTSTTITVNLLGAWDSSSLVGIRHYSLLVRTDTGGSPTATLGSNQPWPYSDAHYWLSWTNEINIVNFGCNMQSWLASSWMQASTPASCSASAGASQVVFTLPHSLFPVDSTAYRVVLDFENSDPNSSGVFQKVYSKKGTSLDGNFIDVD